jgi:cytochrome P450
VEHPEVERRLREEIGAVLGGRAPTLADLPSLDYVNQVIAESMRCYPAFWAMTRETIADDRSAAIPFANATSEALPVSPIRHGLSC